MAARYAIDVSGISKSFDEKRVVNNISIQVETGSIYGFLGPNGSGKTTFLRMLCGLLIPDEGYGTCLGYDIIREQIKIKQKIGYMTQRFSLYSDLTVWENLDFAARLYRVNSKKERLNKILEEHKLTSFKNQLAGTLSGGWKQRLALAVCLVHEPELLLLDEPTAGMDPLARREFWDMVQNLSVQKGITALVTTHYMDEAERCYKLAYLAYGNMLTKGTIDDIIAKEELFTWIVRGKNLLELAESIKNVSAVEQILAFGNTLHISGRNRAELVKLTEFVRSSGYELTEAGTGIEDVFIHLMKNVEEKELK